MGCKLNVWHHIPLYAAIFNFMRLTFWISHLPSLYHPSLSKYWAGKQKITPMVLWIINVSEIIINPLGSCGETVCCTPCQVDTKTEKNCYKVSVFFSVSYTEAAKSLFIVFLTSYECKLAWYQHWSWRFEALLSKFQRCIKQLKASN